MTPATLDRLRFFSDVPDLSTFQWPDAPPDTEPDTSPPVSRVRVAKVGSFKHPRYGKFSITPATFERMISNFDAGIPTDQLPSDFDHEPDFGGSSEANGWVTKLDHDGQSLYATVEWRWCGAWAIRDKAYRYVSPTWSLAYVGEDDTAHGPTLLAFGLTNRPYFSMPAVSLSASFSRDEGGVFEEVSEDAPRPSDSPRRMEFTANIFSALGLKDDADEAAVLAAIEAKDTTTFAGHATLEEAAKAEGKVVFTQAEADAAEAAKTDAQKQAERIEKLEKQSADQRFSTLFDAGVKDLKLAPADEEDLRVIFDAKGAEHFAEYVKRQTPIVNGSAAGARGEEGEDGEVPEGVDPESYRTNQKVQKFMRANPDVDYATALEKVRETEGAAV